VAFRRDSYTCSFSNGSERFDAENGATGNKYLDWLEQWISQFPQGFVHAWVGDQIVGQLEFRIRPEGIGYVNLFYLTPATRGAGFGDQLHDYVTSTFKAAMIPLVRLSVAPTNPRAMAYYKKHGWRDTGPRTDGPDVQLFELLV
jgi:ribosomal protein S18 acetylase RimI-like enzyme